MKAFLLMVGLVCASSIWAVTEPWDRLDWGVAQAMAPGESLSLGSAEAWAVRVLLPGFSQSKRSFSGGLRFRTGAGETLERGGFAWFLEDNLRKVTVQEAPGGEVSAPSSVSWNPVYLEWRRAADRFAVFVVSEGGAAVALGAWSAALVPDSCMDVSLCVSDGEAFAPARFLVVKTASSVPEPGAGIALAVGAALLSLGRARAGKGAKT